MIFPMTDVSPVALRLEEKRLEKGMSHRALGMKSGVNHAYLKNLLEGKSKEPRRSKVEALAAALECPVSYFYGGKGSASDDGATPSAAHMANPKQSQLDGTYGMVRIPEYDVQAAAGSGLDVPDMQDPAKIWTLPKSALAGVQATSLENLAIITVAGESMMPDYMPGEKILVDVGDRIASHDGAYIIHNRYGLVVKMVQIIPGATVEQDILRIISKNPDYTPYDQLVSEANIQGRVVGKWVWK